MDISLIENQIDISHLDQYATIIGECPSKGARSPKLWNAVFESENRNCKMLPLDVKEKNIIILLNDLNKDNKFIGGAIAVPFKEIVAKWLGGNITPEAKKIGAVNCLYRNSKGELQGTNTDGEASLRTFVDEFGSVQKKIIMILGAGGAGKAVISYFSNSAKSILVFTRSKVGQEYAKKINVNWKDWSYINDYIDKVDVVINCTSVGFGDQEMLSPLSKKQITSLKTTTIVFDIIYHPLQTKLLNIAINSGISTFNGLSMNLEQAVLAYRHTVKSNQKLNEIRKIMSKI